MKAYTTGGGAVLDLLSDYTLGRGSRGAAASSTPRMTPARAAHLSRSARAPSPSPAPAPMTCLPCGRTSSHCVLAGCGNTRARAREAAESSEAASDDLRVRPHRAGRAVLAYKSRTSRTPTCSPPGCRQRARPTRGTRPRWWWGGWSGASRAAWAARDLGPALGSRRTGAAAGRGSRTASQGWGGVDRHFTSCGC